MDIDIEVVVDDRPATESQPAAGALLGPKETDSQLSSGPGPQTGVRVKKVLLGGALKVQCLAAMDAQMFLCLHSLTQPH